MRIRIDRSTLAWFMSKKDVSMKQLAKESGVSYSCLSGVRSGRSCSVQTGERIAGALKIDVSELLESSGVLTK
jgi:lambda repressor-like predicted transcriptional regulator